MMDVVCDISTSRLIDHARTHLSCPGAIGYDVDTITPIGEIWSGHSVPLSDTPVGMFCVPRALRLDAEFLALGLIPHLR